VLTVGVDLSAEEANTGLATIEWTAARPGPEDGAGSAAVLVDLQARVGNGAIVQAAIPAAKVGIDCPFGWPVGFTEFVAEHQGGDVRARDGRPLDWRRKLANRETDLYVRTITKLTPLSVSADRIGHAAMRCAALLAELKQAGVPVDRSGQTGAVAEVYPSACLLRWGLLHRRYKHRANRDALDGLVDALLGAAPWLSLGAHERLVRTNDDAFDAVIAALGARAVERGLTEPPPRKDQKTAEIEGWITVPKPGSLGRLVGQPAVG
jgi:predicted nuclease with RNAse H fold